jgi:hypothetical protein
MRGRERPKAAKSSRSSRLQSMRRQSRSPNCKTTRGYGSESKSQNEGAAEAGLPDGCDSVYVCALDCHSLQREKHVRSVALCGFGTVAPCQGPPHSTR